MQIIKGVLFVVLGLMATNSKANQLNSDTIAIVSYVSDICKTYSDDRLGRDCYRQGMSWMIIGTNMSYGAYVGSIGQMACLASYQNKGMVNALIDSATNGVADPKPKERNVCLNLAVAKAGELIRTDLKPEECKVLVANSNDEIRKSNTCLVGKLEALK